MSFLQKEPRLVLDSTVCQVNTRCHLPERLSLPMASDLALSTQPEDTPGASTDFKAAHKQVQVRPEEHGLLLFAFQGNSITIECAVAGLEAPQSLPFCGRPSLFRDSAPVMFALVVLFFCAIAAPISWKKAQFQDSLVWCGWEINFSHDTIQLVSAKLTKLDALIKALLGSRLRTNSGLRTIQSPDLGRGHACHALQALHSLARTRIVLPVLVSRGVNAPPVPGAPVPWKQCYFQQSR